MGKQKFKVGNYVRVINPNVVDYRFGKKDPLYSTVGDIKKIIDTSAFSVQLEGYQQDCGWVANESVKLVSFVRLEDLF
jgi:hypothetical protein